MQIPLRYICTGYLQRYGLSFYYGIQNANFIYMGNNSKSKTDIIGTTIGKILYYVIDNFDLHYTFKIIPNKKS